MESNLGHPDDVTEGVLDGMAHHGSGSVAGDDVNLLEILNKCKKEREAPLWWSRG